MIVSDELTLSLDSANWSPSIVDLQRMVMTILVCAETLFQNVLCNCGIYNAVWSNSIQTRSNKDFGAAGRVVHWISTEECSRIISTSLQSQPPYGPRSSQGEELGAILQPGSWHAGRIERRVLAEDLKIARRDNKAGCSCVNQFFHVMTRSGKGAEQEHRDSTLSISEHK